MRAVLYRGLTWTCTGCPFSDSRNTECPGKQYARSRDLYQVAHAADLGNGAVACGTPMDWSPVELAAVASGLVSYVLREDADPTPAGLSGEGEQSE